MRKETTPDVSLGDVTVSTTAPATGVQKTWRGNRNDDLALPAGAYYLDIRHVDVSGGEIEINGDAIRYGETYNAEVMTDLVNNKQDFVEAISIVANGKEYALRVSYPSSSAFDPNTL